MSTQSSQISNQEQKSALIIVDVQNDFCEGGSLAVRGSLDIIPVINSLRNKPFDYIIFTKDFHPVDHVSFASSHVGHQEFTTITLPNLKQQELWPQHCIQGTQGVELHKDIVYDKESDLIFNKGVKNDVDSYSGFGAEGEDTGLLTRLKELNVEKTFITGLAYDFCVGSTARDSALNGFETYIISDATKSVDNQTKTDMDENLKQYSNLKQIESQELDFYL